MKVKDEDEGVGGMQENVAGIKYCWNCGGYHHILRCTRTLLKENEKGDDHVTLDDIITFLSHTLGLALSHFVSPEDVYFQSGEVDVHNKNKEDEPHHNIAFLSSMCDDCYDSVDGNVRDHSFLRFESCDFPDDKDPKYETLDFSVMSNMDNVLIDISTMDYPQSADSVEPTALVTHVIYMTMEMILLIESLIVEAHIT